MTASNISDDDPRSHGLPGSDNGPSGQGRPDGEGAVVRHERPANGVRSDHRRELAAILVAVLLGGGSVLFAASRVWLSVTALRAAPFGPLTAEVSGRSEFGALAGLAVVILLAAVLALVTGRWARRLLGLLICLAAVLAGWYCLRGFGTPGAGRLVELLGGTARVGQVALVTQRHPVWPAVGLLGAALAALGGLALLLRAGDWPTGLSARYETPAAAAMSDDPWRALDRGDDPTITDR